MLHITKESEGSRLSPKAVSLFWIGVPLKMPDKLGYKQANRFLIAAQRCLSSRRLSQHKMTLFRNA